MDGARLLGEIRGDRALRDPGVFLYASELAAIEAYWFDVNGENFRRLPAPRRADDLGRQGRLRHLLLR